MEILLVRHGESSGNAAGRLQGRAEYPLTALGREQARRLGKWITASGFGWDAAYASPLSRASETAAIVTAERGIPGVEPDPDLAEVDVGDLEGLDRDAIAERYPSFLERGVTDLGDFTEFGGESYDSLQARVGRVIERLCRKHRGSNGRLLVVAHGGINFQIVKAAVCIPVPRVCVVRWGNCTAAMLKFRERRGVFLAEIGFHVPVELMGAPAGNEASALFR